MAASLHPRPNPVSANSRKSKAMVKEMKWRENRHEFVENTRWRLNRRRRLDTVEHFCWVNATRDNSNGQRKHNGKSRNHWRGVAVAKRSAFIIAFRMEYLSAEGALSPTRGLKGTKLKMEGREKTHGRNKYIKWNEWMTMGNKKSE